MSTSVTSSTASQDCGTFNQLSFPSRSGLLNSTVSLKLPRSPPTSKHRSRVLASLGIVPKIPKLAMDTTFLHDVLSTNTPTLTPLPQPFTYKTPDAPSPGLPSTCDPFVTSTTLDSLGPVFTYSLVSHCIWEGAKVIDLPSQIYSRGDPSVMSSVNLASHGRPEVIAKSLSLREVASLVISGCLSRRSSCQTTCSSDTKSSASAVPGEITAKYKIGISMPKASTPIPPMPKTTRNMLLHMTMPFPCLKGTHTEDYGRALLPL